MALAALTIPVNVRTAAQASDVAKIVAAATGSSDVAVDPTAGKVTLRYEFPGDIDLMMRPLYARGLANSATLAISLPVRAAAGATVDATQLVAQLNAARAVSNAAYDGAIVSATIAAASAALRDFHARIVGAGLIPR